MAFQNSPKIPTSAIQEAKEKDATLIGSHCQDPYCNQLDFLPFKCASCSGTFCLDHRSETAHRCPKAGEWARKRSELSQSQSNITAGGRRLGDEEEKKTPCAGKGCKIVTNTVGRNPGVKCETCRRTYCLNHRLKEDHDCKNLVPLGPAPRGQAVADVQEKTRFAFSRLRAWGSSKKAEATAVTQEAVGRVLPKPKPSSAAARVVAVNALKKSAKGDEKLAMEKRVYLYVEAEAATAKAKLPKGEFFFSKDWVVGRVLDDAARRLGVENINNQSEDERDKLRVFHVEGGRLLEFGEKLGTAAQSGNTIVLLRGVGPAIPNLIGDA